MRKEREKGTQSSKEKIGNSVGDLIVFTGFSGAGKTDLRDLLLNRNPPYEMLVTATTRKPQLRNGLMEQGGIHYHFIDSEEAFFRGVANGEFLEWAPYRGNYYGTHIRELEKLLERRNLVSTMEMRGAGEIYENILKFYGEKKAPAISNKTKVIYIDGGDKEELQRRFIKRGGGTYEDFKSRYEQDLELYKTYGERFKTRVNNYRDQITYAIEDVEKIIGLSPR